MKINEHDITRGMLKTIRQDRFINENLDSTSDEEELTSAELSEQQTNFRKTVSPRVEFTGFKVYPKSKNVVFSGKFENMGGLEWEFTLEDTHGLYISANNVPFSDDTIETIKKLKGFYDNWADEWAEKLATEYNREAQEGEQEVQNSDVV
jgi:hypothetical protein|tara:strand:+ start:6872 stop:7321 length:450 start_codon:yes stop_codon:yes gene_type:complete